MYTNERTWNISFHRRHEGTTTHCRCVMALVGVVSSVTPKEKTIIHKPKDD